MNLISRLMAAFAVVFTMLGAMCVQAQQPKSVIQPSPLPVYIPTAPTIDGLRDWIATNQLVQSPVTLYYYGTDGIRRGYGLGGIWTNWSSYAAYRTNIANTALILVGWIRTNQITDLSQPIRVAAPIFYTNTASGAPSAPSGIDTYAPTLDTITFDWLMQMPSAYDRVVIPVPGLQTFTVIVSNSPSSVYSNGWSAANGTIQNNSVGQFPPELTTSNWLVLNSWYLMQQNHTRISATKAGQAKTYTQFGAQITPSTLFISPDGRSIDVRTAPGADVTLEQSVDMLNWTSVGTCSGLTSATDMPFTIDPTTAPYRFYRARSE